VRVVKKTTRIAFLGRKCRGGRLLRDTKGLARQVLDREFREIREFRVV
jgi:hypothetical protein